MADVCEQLAQIKCSLKREIATLASNVVRKKLMETLTLNGVTLTDRNLYLRPLSDLKDEGCGMVK